MTVADLINLGIMEGPAVIYKNGEDIYKIYDLMSAYETQEIPPEIRNMEIASAYPAETVGAFYPGASDPFMRIDIVLEG